MGEAQTLRSLLEDFDTAMLITLDTNNTPRARPMHVVDRESDGTLWFATSLASGKVSEVVDDAHVAATMQSSRKFVSLSGRGRIVRDRTRIRELWSDAWRPWFPEGPDDPNIALIKLEPTAGEYWDMSGTKGIRYLIRAATAVLQKDRPEPPSVTEHGTV